MKKFTEINEKSETSRLTFNEAFDHMSDNLRKSISSIINSYGEYLYDDENYQFRVGEKIYDRPF